MSRHYVKFTPEMVYFIYSICENKTCKEIAELTSKEFGITLNEFQIRGVKQRYNIKSYKNGHFCKNIGKQILDKDGYIIEKVKDCSKYATYRHQNKDGSGWILAHHKIWIDSGKMIPLGYNLCFKNKDKTDLRLENLILVKRDIMGKMCRNNRFSKNADITQCNLTLTKLKDVIKNAGGCK